MSSRPVQPGEFKRRIYNGSGLDIIDRGLLAYLAWHAEKHRDADGWFAVDQDTIAKDNGCGRSTVQRRLPRLVEKGWLRCRKYVKDGRYQTTQYLLTVPVTNPKPGVTVAHGPGISEKHGPGISEKHGSMLLSHAASGPPEMLQRRSPLPKDGDDDAAPRGGVGNGLEVQIQTASPAPPARKASEPDDAEPKPETRSWEEVEAQLLDDMQAEHRDDRFGELASMWADQLTGKTAEQRRRERERDRLHRRRQSA